MINEKMLTLIEKCVVICERYHRELHWKENIHNEITKLGGEN